MMGMIGGIADTDRKNKPASAKHIQNAQAWKRI